MYCRLLEGVDCIGGGGGVVFGDGTGCCSCSCLASGSWTMMHSRCGWLAGRASAGWKLPLALALAVAAACFLLVVSSNRKMDDGDY